jgi:hypothetical protein
VVGGGGGGGGGGGMWIWRWVRRCARRNRTDRLDGCRIYPVGQTQSCPAFQNEAEICVLVRLFESYID